MSRLQSLSLLVMFVFAVLLVGARPAGAAEAFTDQRQLGLKYSSLTKINAKNVAQLQLAWEAHTGELATSKNSLDAFQDEPSVIAGNLANSTSC